MAKASGAARPSGLTTSKAIFIGVLALVLLVVLGIQFGGGGDEPAPGATARKPAPPPIRSAAARKTSNNQRTSEEDPLAFIDFDQTRWKTPDVTQVIAYDPFALPTAFPQPNQSANASGDGEATDEGIDDGRQLAAALEKLRTQLDDLQKRGVQVIISQDDRYVAMIGDRMIHVGDEINGFTVTQINPDGVRVELKDTQ